MTKYANIIIRRGYLEQNPFCEITRALHGPEWDGIRKSYAAYTGGECVHHIARRKSKLFDTRPNWITVDMASHAFCHKYEDLGMLCCLYVKLLKDEFDSRTINCCMGAVREDADPLRAWLDGLVLPDDQWRGMKGAVIYACVKRRAVG